MINKVVLVGRLTADPELKQTQSGISVTSNMIWSIHTSPTTGANWPFTNILPLFDNPRP